MNMHCFRFLCFLVIFTCLTVKQVEAVSMTQPDSYISDSLLTVDAIRRTSVSDPDNALVQLNEAERREVLPAWQIYWMRAQIYGGTKRMQRMAVKWGKLALEEDSVRNNPQYYFNMCKNLVESMIAAENYDEAVRYAQSMVDVLERSGKPKDNAHVAFHAIARVYRKTGDPEKAYEFMDEAIRLCRQLLERRKETGTYVVSVYLDLVQYYQSCSVWLSEDGKPEEALTAALQMQEMVEALRPLKGGPYPKQIPDRAFYRKEGIAAGMLALLNERIGQEAKGREWFAKMQANPLVGQDMDLLACEIDYHKERDDYGAVVAKARRLATPLAYEDTVSTRRREACLVLAEASRRLGWTEEALANYEMAMTLTDSLHLRQNKQDALEMATLLETEEKERQIEVQAGELRWHRGITAFVSAMLLMAGVILVLAVRHSRTVDRKNKSMAVQIDLYLAYRDDLQAARDRIRLLEEQAVEVKRAEEAVTMSMEVVALEMAAGDAETGKGKPTEEDRALFEDIDRQIREGELFLNPELTRDMVLRLTPIGKNRLSPLIQAFTGENFNGYINRLRLDYSLMLLKDFRQYTIEAVAIDSGFGNVRTYQRIFRDAYGMTPVEYRKTLG